MDILSNLLIYVSMHPYTPTHTHTMLFVWKALSEYFGKGFPWDVCSLRVAGPGPGHSVCSWSWRLAYSAHFLVLLDQCFIIPPAALFSLSYSLALESLQPPPPPTLHPGSLQSKWSMTWLCVSIFCQNLPNNTPDSFLRATTSILNPWLLVY